MNRKKIIALLVLKQLDKYLPQIKNLSPEKIPLYLDNIVKRNSLSNDNLGDFIQEKIINTLKLHKKEGVKQILSAYAKDHKIRGLLFPSY